MTPKEKAYELIIKFQLKPEGINKELAKRCALIAVDELIKYVQPDPSFPGYNEWFWEEVKQEIEKL